VHVKAGHATGEPIYVAKIASWTPANAERGLPPGNGGVLVCSATTGTPLAFLADEHYLTDIRTAAAGALATDLLAPLDAIGVAVLGGGIQARLQVLTLAHLRNLGRVLVWARRPEAAASVVRDLKTHLPAVDVRLAASPQEAVKQAEIVITATASRVPLIKGAWLRSGQHLTALGADDDHKRELDAECFARASLVAVDSRSQTCTTAELSAAIASNMISEHSIVELGELISGVRQGRTGKEAITIAKLTGIAVQDLACARIALERLGIAI
jgi:ornithine cyclodeaminase